MGPRCECGAARLRGRTACDGCTTLELASVVVESSIVGFLKDLGGLATTYEIADASGYSHRQLLRLLQKLAAAGYILRIGPHSLENDTGVKKTHWQLKKTPVSKNLEGL